MNTNDILKYVHELDWNCPNDIQRKAIPVFHEDGYQLDDVALMRLREERAKKSRLQEFR